MKVFGVNIYVSCAIFKCTGLDDQFQMVNMLICIYLMFSKKDASDKMRFSFYFSKTSLVMILVLIPLFVLSLTQTRSTQTPLSQVLERLKKYPLDVTAHKNLLQLYISYKQLALAKQEFQLLQEPLNSLFGDFQVLGVDSQTQQALQILTDTPRIHSEQKSYW